MKAKTILAVAVFSVITGTSFTQEAQAASKASTFKNDKARIKQGVQSGQLTYVEAQRLEEQTKKLQDKKKEIKTHSLVTKKERKEFRKDKKQLSRRIYKQKHDRQVR